MSLQNLTDQQLKEYYQLFQSGLQDSKRFESQKIHNADTKFLYHIVRLLLECEQILTEHDLDLTRNREQLKAIRRGEVKEQDIYDLFSLKERELDKLYHESVLQHSPNESKIKQLLLNCLEQHYGSLSNCVVMPEKAETVISELVNVLKKYGYTS